MPDVVLLGPPRYEDLMPLAVQQLTDAGLQVVPNPTDKPLTPEHIASYAADCVAVIAEGEPWGPAQLDLLPNLKIISRCGVGLDNIDLAAARERGVQVTNTPGMNSNAVAELTVGLILAALRGFVGAACAHQHGDRTKVSGPELTGASVGIVGWGQIGRLVAKRLRGFDVQLLVYDPFVTPESSEMLTPVGSLEELVASADIVTLHVPAVEANVGLVSADLLAHFKRGSYLINTARGALIDESALAEAVRSGVIARAALDVLVDEVDPLSSPLMGLDQVIITPHLAAESTAAFAAVGQANAQDVLDVLEGRTPQRLVN